MAKTASAKPDATNPVLDWTKWGLVAVLVVSAIVGNWYYQDQSLLYRALGVVALAAVAVFVALQTGRGRSFAELLKEARLEIRRVVWPSRDETTQTTLIVLVLIIIFSLILWGLDSLLSWVVQGVIG